MGNLSHTDEISVISLHVPDVLTFLGLCDMMLLRNVCELGVLLQRWFYEGGTIPDINVEECRMVHWQYQQFQTWL